MSDRKLYHGSRTEFDQFKIQSYHRTGGAMGYGIYLTNSTTRALTYAENEYLYTVDLKPSAFKQARTLSVNKLTLTHKEATFLIEELTKEQIKNDGYPYMLSDWEEVSSETDLDQGNRGIARRIATKLLEGNSTDIDFLNDVGNQIGGNESAAELLNPILSKMGVHYVTSPVKGELNQLDYLVFNPDDLIIQGVYNLKQPDESSDQNASDELSH